jgi:PAS domain-containing protein
VCGKSDVLGDLIDSLLPDIAPKGDVARALEELATAQETTHYDLAALEVVAKHCRGELMAAEVLVSMMTNKRQPTYIMCVRDTAERSKAEDALKDSEARYRVLVEKRPEAVVVLDVESGRFIDCNDNATDFFRMSRESLLRLGPVDVSPATQPDGSPSVALARGYIEQAIGGATPVFEWMHVDAEGKGYPVRSEARPPAELVRRAGPRQHHRHFRPEAGRAHSGRRAPCAREDRLERAARCRAGVDHRGRRARAALVDLLHPAVRPGPALAEPRGRR